MLKLFSRMKCVRVERAGRRVRFVYRVRWWHPLTIWEQIKSALRRDFGKGGRRWK